MSNAQWLQIDATTYSIDGLLDRDTVPILWPTLSQWSPSEQSVEVSLEQIKRVDSAGMVMLIHLIEHAKKQNCHIMLSFVPKQLSTLFQLSNVDELIAGHVKNK
ncbi:STAS domain-containing protein [Vibrio sinensis]|uniref:STAS domain-containing protein n=1 Tax=Vibrio sinensis TaxID=2302434 RepID=A0A3A6QK96_9VIBR|nr:lipid asymmetry maintenance protein MlaB [Vibrio sinensis]RJX70644.1 STAS domain-containing protein [Vibrio sinensis]